MSEIFDTQNENPIDNFLEDFEEVENDDTNGIFGSSEMPLSPDSPQQEDFDSSEAGEFPQQNMKTSEPPLQFDPFDAALKKAQATSEQRVTEGFAAKPPAFSYASAKENITDAEITFDGLRQKYETDFPELEDKKKVSWIVTYGKVTKAISNPEGDKVYEVKSTIEGSKQFIENIKKAKVDKEKEPECIVTPKVIAQSKGEALSSFKGIYTNLEDAYRDNKPIMIVPSQDGKVYEIRKNEIGTFITPAAKLPELPFLTPTFQFKLPKIPFSILNSIVSFFKKLCDRCEMEALVNIYFDKSSYEYTLKVPKQTISKVSVNATLEDDCADENLIHVMDIHSHNTMPAKFSSTDDNDEKTTRLYAVVGKLDGYFPEIRVRMSNGGKFLELPANDIFETSIITYPEQWENQIVEQKKLPMPYLGLLDAGDSNEIR